MKVFVYGSLRKGQHNHGFLKGAKFLGEAHTGPGYTLKIRGLPFLLEDDNGEGCSGELYEVSPLILQLLDRLECHPDWYVRTPITVIQDTDLVKCSVYLMPPERMGR